MRSLRGQECDFGLIVVTQIPAAVVVPVARACRCADTKAAAVAHTAAQRFQRFEARGLLGRVQGHAFRPLILELG